MTSMEEDLQEVIAVEHVSLSHLRFFVSTQLETCRSPEEQIDAAQNNMQDETKTDDERSEAHGKFHELVEEPCPISTRIEAVVEDFVLRFDHDCRGIVDIDINLAKIASCDVPAAVLLLEKQISAILTEAMLSIEPPRIVRYGTL